MTYQVTARKWRPMVFEDVIGQAHVTGTLKNALATNRLAHAFIFCGGRGCGKTTTARILAKVVNCLHPKEANPCNECEVCEEITNGRSLDVIEIDGASNRGVDEIRNLRESVRYAPARGKYKVYIIDEVHMLTKEAFNALLKTLEEPPAHVLFIFATTEVHKVPATILSRCQRYDFRRITVDDIIARLKYIATEEKITIDDDSLLIIAKKGDGSMRDAQSIFDQVVSYCGTTITAEQAISVLNVVDQEFFFRVTDCVKAHDTQGGLALVDEIVRNGFDIKDFLTGLTEHLRNLLITKTTGSVHLIEASELYRKRYTQDAAHFDEQDILRLIKLSGDMESSVRFSAQPRFRLEVGIIQMTKMAQSVKIDDLLQRLEELKKKLNSGIAVTKAPGAHTDTPSAFSKEPPRPSPFIVPKKEEVPIVERVNGGNGAPIPPEAPTAPVVDVSIPIPSGSFTIEHVSKEWQRIVDEIRKKKISVGTILGESSPIEVSSDTLHIACFDEFHVSSLKRNQVFLTEAVNTLLGSKLRIEPVLKAVGTVAPPASGGNGEPKRAVAEPSNAVQSSPLKEHPVIETLYRDFGAERI